MKNHGFLAHLGYALAGIQIAFRREKSFRAQSLFGVAAILALILLRPARVWAAIIGLCIALVLALEMANAAFEYLIDRVHPDIHGEIKFAKAATVGAVLIASIAAAGIGAMMVASVVRERWLS